MKRNFLLAAVLSAGLAFTAQAEVHAKEEKVEKDLYAELQAVPVKDDGLFTIYQQDGKYYFEIPDSLFRRDMLLITRREKTAMDMGFGGETMNERLLFWEKRDDKKVDLRVKSRRIIAEKGSAMEDAVSSIMLPAILKTFDIKGFSPDSSSVLLDVTDLFLKDDLAFGLDGSEKSRFKITRQDESRSYISSVRSFPENIEVSSVKTYEISNSDLFMASESLRSVTLQIRNSLLLLPSEPMRPRYGDERIGFFARMQWDYSRDDAQRAISTSYIKRWRLEPADKEAFLRGELVEPVKPIVYYLSPCIPEQWVEYFKQGVEDWQAAFEQAGFKNAILARTVPSKEEDPDFDPLDVRYSMIEYLASDIENSYGPHISDPRSGEILGSHVCIYQNVMKLLHDWYMIQCGAQDPEARKMVYSEELMGRLIRFLVSHEVGHTLGLAHNFAASKAYPVDSLRSATFTKVHGTAPSIMDYARFNYVAQPEDKGVYLFPKIGDYDKYAIEWGYRPLPEAETPEDERLILNDYIKKHADDPTYRYIRQLLVQFDPRGLTEDLGDDAVKASGLGLRNLEYVFGHLEEWTAREGHGNRDLEDLYHKACRQWRLYLGHVASNIGGVYETYKSADQPGDVYSLVEKEKQQEAVRFLAEHAMHAPDWITSQPYISRFNNMLVNLRDVQQIQSVFVDKMLNVGVLLRITEHHAQHPENAYDPKEYLNDVKHAVWDDLYSASEGDLTSRVLQRVYLKDCKELMEWNDKGRIRLTLSVMEFKTLIRHSLQGLRDDLRKKVRKTSDEIARLHYEESIQRIGKMLESIQ